MVQDEDDIPNWFKNKNKIPYTVYSKINFSINKVIKIKIPKDKIHLINFFYVYSLFVSTDAELFFYYAIYNKKFDFCEKLFSKENLFNKLKSFFEKYDLEYLSIKQHLKNYNTSVLNYQNHLIKISLIQYNKEKETYEIDYSYINKCYESVIKDIYSYSSFLELHLKKEEEIQKLLNKEDETYLEEETEKLNEILENIEEKDEEFKVEPGDLCRNLFNFSKLIIMNYSGKDIKATRHIDKLNHLHFKNPTYQKYYLYNYGILVSTNHDFKKCLTLDYNMRFMRYKINLSHLGKVAKKFSKFQFFKKFHFFPDEILQKITFATIDQLYIFTLFPIILFKIQNSLIYYYNTNILLNKFSKSFSSFNQIDIKLVIQCFNSRTTLEINNYERLEFLGDAILKFLSSVELYVKFPRDNRDLLFSKRRLIENNKNLFEKAKNLSLQDLIFTSPITIKRVKIPGFTKDESLIFDISYNRSFTKNCYNHKRKLNEEIELDLIKKEKERENKEEEKKKLNEEEKKITKYQKMEIKNIDENIEELKTDRTTIEIEYIGNKEGISMEKSLPINREIIKDIIENKIEIESNETFRFIYTKTLADIIESITALCYNTSLFNNFSIEESFNFTSIFLKESNILISEYKENISKITENSIKNLLNPKCKFKENQREKFFEVILENKKYNFKNKELVYQAMTHPSSLTEENIEKGNNYVNKSYQRLAFLGEAIVELFVSIFVYENNKHDSEESLHKMRICGINHHMISLMAINLNLHQCLLKN